MIVWKCSQENVYDALASVAGIVNRGRRDGGSESRRGNPTITAGFPLVCGGSVDECGEACGSDTGSAASASDDDGGDGDGDGDPDSDRRKRSATAYPFPPALIGLSLLSHYVGFGRSRIYQLIAAGEFPPPVKVGKSSRWVRAEIDSWLSAQIAARPVTRIVGG